MRCGRVRGAIRYLDSVARSLSRRGLGRGGSEDVGTVLADAVEGSPGRLACLATHGRGRSLLLGSVAVSLLERSTGPPSWSGRWRGR